MWLEYIDTRKELEFLVTQETELLKRLAYSQEVDADGNRLSAEADLQVSST